MIDIIISQPKIFSFRLSELYIWYGRGGWGRYELRRLRSITNTTIRKTRNACVIRRNDTKGKSIFAGLPMHASKYLSFGR